MTHQLEKCGYTVVNVPKEVYGGLREKILDAVNSFTEFNDDATDRSPIGGFGVFGLPSSFHHPVIREARLSAYDLCVPLLQSIYGKEDENLNLEILFDRLMVRKAKTAPQKETWHRDEAPNALEEDIILGGWWNLDDTPNYFSCVPGSQRRRRHKGFVKITDKKKLDRYKRKKVLVEVPPGSIILFYENIVHEVLSTKLSYDSVRLFLGWRLTKCDKPMTEDLSMLLDEQGSMPIKSGQLPHNWTNMHWMHWQDKLEDYSKKFRVQCTSIKSVKKTGRQIRVVDRFMSTLKRYNLPLYDSYTVKERSIYFPHKLLLK